MPWVVGKVWGGARWQWAGLLSHHHGLSLSQAGLGLHATLISRTATVSYMQSFELICRMSASRPVEELLLSVGWLFQPKPPTDGYQELVHVLPDGTVSWGRAQPRFQGKAQLMKAGAFSRLHIHSAVAGHAGTYQCKVGVWRTLQGQPTVSFTSNAVGINVVPPGEWCCGGSFCRQFLQTPWSQLGQLMAGCPPGLHKAVQLILFLPLDFRSP